VENEVITENEIIIEVGGKKSSPKSKKQKKKKAVNKTASKNIKKVDKNTQNSKLKKNNVRTFNQVKHKKNKKRLKVLLIVILIVISLILLLSSNLFNIKEIIVENNQKLSSDEIISLSRIEKDKNIFAINKYISRYNIKENPYVDTVNIKRVLPSKMKIIIEERVPTYMLNYADSYVYISKDGYMIEISNEKLNIPTLLGTATDLNEIKIGTKLSIDDLKTINTVNNIKEVSNNHGIGNLITYIDISDTRNYKLILESEGKTVYLGDGSDLNTRILYLKSILDETDGEHGEIFLNVDINTEKVRFRKTT